MSQATTFGFPLVAGAPTTPTVVAAQADNSLDALLSSHSGASRPTYAVDGTVWQDSDTKPWYMYDGTTDWPMGHEYLKATTALSDAAATLTAAQLLTGLFTITPTAGRALTTATAVEILAAMPPHVDGSYFEFTVVCLAAFAATITAGVGVTLVGDMAPNNASATFLVYRTAATTVTMVRK